MVRRENIESKISSIRSFLIKLERYRSIPVKTIQDDQDLSGATERYLFLAAQASIDLAEMICKLKKLGKPMSMAEAFEYLLNEGVIDEKLCSSLIKMVGFRNVLSHGYEHLDYTIVADVLNNRLDDIKTFVDRVESYL